MATYVTLYNFTDQGFKNIKDTVKRVEAATKAASQIGLKLKEFLWTKDNMTWSQSPKLRTKSRPPRSG